jgi:hypothetical protein
LGISDKAPRVYLAEIKSRDRSLLTGHFIPDDPRVWEVEKFSSFLKARRSAIAKAINDYISGFSA